jgi:TonB family protein
MTASIALRDVVAYAVQVTLLVGAGALLAQLFRLRASVATLIFWQSLLGICLILPFCQPWKIALVKPLPSTLVASVAPGTTPSAAEPARDSRALFDWRRGFESLWSRRAGSWTLPLSPARQRAIEYAALLLMAAGMLVRGLWLATGFLALAKLRRGSGEAPRSLVPTLHEAQRLLGVHADFRTSGQAAAPITFGWRRPLILLPENVGSMETRAQRAIVCHELVHVRRRDWPWCVAEECARAMFWFHPAVNWLIGRIHLTREQVVDEAVISLTASRESYVKALLAVAQGNLTVQPVPAPLFLRKNLLKSRVAEILKEKTMTARRLAICLILSTAALFATVRISTSIFPLRVHAQELSSAPIQVLQGGDNLTYRAAIVYPRGAMDKQIEGDVALELAVDNQGQVSDARVLSGPEELRRACLQSVLEWRFRTPSPGNAEVVVHFQLPADGSKSEFVLPPVPAEGAGEGHLALIVKDSDIVMNSDIVKLKTALADPAATPEERAVMKKELAERMAQDAARDQSALDAPHSDTYAFVNTGAGKVVTGRLTRISAERVPQSSLDSLKSQLNLQVGDWINEETARRAGEVVHQNLGEQFRALFHPDGDGGVEVVIVGPGAADFVRDGH